MTAGKGIRNRPITLLIASLCLILPVLLTVAEECKAEENLREKDFRGQDHSGRDFSGANLIQANLRNANFSGAGLFNAILSSAKMDGTDFSGATLENAELLFLIAVNPTNFSNANLRCADFRISMMSNTAFSGTDLSYSNFAGGSFAGANFSDADLTGANLGIENLEEHKMLGAERTLADPLFELAQMMLEMSEYTILKGAVIAGDMTGAVLTDANLTGTDLRLANGLSQTQLDQACQMAGPPPLLPEGLIWKGRPCATQDFRRFRQDRCDKIGKLDLIKDTLARR